MTIFHGRWRQFILHLMGKEDPPEKVAAAFALGIAISFFTPLTGFHTLIALGLAFLLGLSKVDVVMGTFVVNPWTVVPVITFEEFLGKKILHYSPSLAPRLPWRELLHRQFWHTLRGSGLNYLAALTVGSVLVSSAAATATYFLVRGVILRYERTHPQWSARLRRTEKSCAVREDESDGPARGRK
ncbi:MAG: DUF2062 domain-containing protein [Thermoanaerobaculia bacterium]